MVSDVHAAAPDSLAPDRGTCREVLAELRSVAPALEPTPDPALDGAVGTWVEVAEGAFFDCDPSRAEDGPFARSFAELERLEAEVAVVIEIDQAE